MQRRTERTLVLSAVGFVAAAGAAVGVMALVGCFTTGQSLPNFSQVSEVLYRGGQPTVAGFAALEQMGVRTVVSLRRWHSNDKHLGGLELRQVHIKCRAGHPREEDVLAFLQVVTDPSAQPVFVHCWHGSDRTGLMVAAYRMVCEGWNAQEAVDELLDPRFGHHEFWYPALKEFVRKLDAAALREALGLPVAAPVAP